MVQGNISNDTHWRQTALTASWGLNHIKVCDKNLFILGCWHKTHGTWLGTSSRSFKFILHQSTSYCCFNFSPVWSTDHRYGGVSRKCHGNIFLLYLCVARLDTQRSLEWFTSSVNGMLCLDWGGGITEKKYNCPLMTTAIRTTEIVAPKRKMCWFFTSIL